MSRMDPRLDTRRVNTVHNIRSRTIYYYYLYIATVLHHNYNFIDIVNECEVGAVHSIHGCYYSSPVFQYLYKSENH